MNKVWKALIIIALFVGSFFGGYGLIYASNSLKAAALEENKINEINEPEVVDKEDGTEDKSEGSGSAKSDSKGQAHLAPVKPDDNSKSPSLLGDSQLIASANLDSILILANKSWSLPADYVPEDLVTVEAPFVSYALPERRQMRSEAAAALLKLVEAAKLEGEEILCVSGYRSYGTQKVIFDNKVKAVGMENAVKYVAYPGQSEHQTGLAMDVTSKELISGAVTSAFGKTKEAKWLVDNSHRYGFIIRYQAGKEGITGYNYEPWHIRYVGKDDAQAIYEQGLTLEEYLGAVEDVEEEIAEFAGEGTEAGAEVDNSEF